MPGIRAISGRASMPGWVLIEALDQATVNGLCEGLYGIYRKNTHIVGTEDAVNFLKVPTTYEPRPNTWVRLRSKPYRGDLAFVVEVDASLALKVRVVPRIDMRGAVGKSGKRRRDLRPNRQLFDVRRVKRVFGPASVKDAGDAWIFGNKLYRNGLLEMWTSRYHVHDITPTVSELEPFRVSSGVPSNGMEVALHTIQARRISKDDSVKVLSGEARGLCGVVMDVGNGEAEIRLEQGNQPLTVSLDHLRKIFHVADQVMVTGGPRRGFIGWVVGLEDDNVFVAKYQSPHQVSFPYQPARSLPLMTKKQICVPAAMLRFHGGSPRIRPEEKKEVTTNAEVGAEFEDPDFTDPCWRLVGKRVMIVKKGPFKSYEGIVKCTQDNNQVLVEIQATMRKESIDVDNIKSLEDDDTESLIVKAPQAPPRVEPPVSEFISPATPMHSIDNRNPWMSVMDFDNYRIKVKISRTKPVVRDPGWRNGDYEGRTGLWTQMISGTNIAKVKLNVAETLEIPEYYLSPVLPTQPGMVVCVLNRSLYEYTYRKYIVVKVEGDRCLVRPESSKLSRSGKEVTAFDTKDLGVVVP
ncbi:Transcription elongation factor SPT5 [Hypsizygus marmoreus]|uniref:Transcription elongation factor SPT5 n=1 Tax=Hypsizygus marmoreus TaxID=39966 RepID=A0A369K6D8_HYPMA|nr:Transcription elongation factor SPT5 [Hypsizygus marmoreus]